MNKAKAILKAASSKKKKAAKKAKIVRKSARRDAVRPIASATLKSMVKPVGVVTHFYRKIKVAIVRFKKPITVGATIAFRGHQTDFEHKIASMQLDYKEIKRAPKGKQVGIKVAKRVREGDEVFEA